MDPYHHYHPHHHHHHPLNYPQPSSSPFDPSPVASGRPAGRTAANSRRAGATREMTLGRGPPQTMQYPLQTAFTRSYDSESTSPGDVVASVADSFQQAGTAAISTPRGSTSTSNPKRAYRQRRKDPSCDACRERKVKCDATETASCSECSSRNVRCQFTKETNRRMSSIKQFQDLEKQLQQAQQQLAQFRSIVPKGVLAIDSDPGSPPDHGAEARSGRSPRRKMPPIFEDFSEVRANLKDYGRGLLQIPKFYREAVPQSNQRLEMPELPSRHIADRLLTSYYEHFHLQFPILHWPTFESECDQLYRRNSLASLGNARGAVFLSVLACGTLQSPETSQTLDGKAFLTTAVAMANLWQDDFSIHDVRMAFLAGVFFTELNLKSAGWLWLGSAVRISQDIGLHAEGGTWSPIEREMRRRLWYCIYTWDRLLALELGKPLLINDDDYDTEYPEPVEDEQITREGIHSTRQPTLLLSTINVVRSFQSLTKLLRSRCITREALRSRDDYLQTCLSLFPKNLQPSALEPLDPRAVTPLISLQNTRLLLHRHNLNPTCPVDLRLEAIDICVKVAQDTAMTLSRCLDSALHPKQAAAETARLLARSASTLLCMHIWRCLLFLLFRADYLSATVLVQAASAIGGAREVNLCCGRYIEFFLRVLYSRLQQGHSGGLDDDEEMIAYVSGDLQSDSGASWVWQGRDVVNEEGNLATSAQPLPTSDQARPGPVNDVMDRGVRDWGGWEHVESGVRYLLEQQQIQQQTSHRPAQQQQPQPSPASLPSNTSRMTIASII